MDAFGNLTEVDETDPTLGAVSTYYTYDILNHLTQVRMPRGANTQYRTFDYTGGTSTVGALLLSATNPETNNLPVSYTYNANKQLTTKTDANGNQFVYTYDSSGRLTLVTANGNTLRTFYYDTNPFDNSQTFSQYTAGRLTAIVDATYSVTTPAGSTPYYFTEMFGYQQAPAITTKRLRLTETVTYATGGYPPYNQATVRGNLDATYTYDNEGRVLTTAYPATQYGAGPSYSYQLDGMGRLSGMTDQNLNQVVSGVTYGPANELDTITYFGHIETRGYNTLFQLTSLNGITYAYTAGANNGKISSQTYTGSGETVQYTYDTLNRLASAAGSGWSQTFTYDGFGNLTNRTPSGPATPADPATNRLSSGYSYDNNGNLLTIGYAYDAENRLISALSGSVRYSYDSQNKRIWQANFDSNGYLTSENVYLYGVDGKKLGMYNPTVTYAGRIPQSIVFNQNYQATTNAYFGGKLIQQGGTTFVPDRLESNGKYFPYGEERNYPALPNDQVKFATYTRDSATGLDYADQRYYASSFGRFMTADPYKASIGGSDPGSPQSWNRYAYVQGDPVNYNDHSGLIRSAQDCINDPDSCEAEDGNYGPEVWIGAGNEGGFGAGGNPCSPAWLRYAAGAGIPSGCNAPPPPLPPPVPTCEEQLTATISAALAGTPLAGEASDFVSDAQNAGLNPLLLVAVAWAESQYGATAPRGSNNAFGLLHPVKGSDGKVHYVPNRYPSGWNGGIVAAGAVIDNQFVRGNVTVSLLYSGQPGAYCVGAGCSVGEANVENDFRSLGGGDPNNPFNLLWPCP